ncbi:MAG: nucleotidyltransferase family protein [Clostridium perfringens]|nr:nucleotidyltransferase family protein [Clostridium perfringens]
MIININGLILVAGLSSRMNDFKPLMNLDEKPVIFHTIDSMLNANVDKIVLVLGYRGSDVEKAVSKVYDSNKIIFIYNSDFKTSDMLASIKIGLRAMPQCDAFYLLPGDMPMVSKEVFLNLAKCIQGHEKLIVFPSLNGYKKHPPLISASLIQDILSFNEAGGLRKFFEKTDSNILTIETKDIGCSLDLDTQDDFKNLKQYLHKI